jgi:predicted glycoside hydrolase/deacetylase ChbG (UPF0249 family)
MKYLIVNGDDFGASRGINRGIMEAHQRGILTSASLLVNRPASNEAAALSRTAPELSVGLHVDLERHRDAPAAASPGRLRAELREQFARFQALMGRAPTHLDSHHNVHRAPDALPHFLELARTYDLPLREHSPVRYFPSFYGRWGGESHLEQISVESLARILEREIGDGFTELSCHPGYVDPDYPSGYTVEREAELRTLCSRRIIQTLAEQLIQLVNYHELAKMPAGPAR